MNKVSLIVTVLNEEETIFALLESVAKQALRPDEVIMVDGGSIDNTVSLVEDFIKNRKKTVTKNSQKVGQKNLTSNFAIKIFVKKGNRSVGRNFAISQAKNDWVAITDAGCVLDKNWLKELVEKQKKLGAEVVAGYYKAANNLAGKPLTSFQKAVVPYVLVMPDKVNGDNFLPATRSVLLTKNIWKKVGGFDENLSDNEDYAFAKKLEQNFEQSENQKENGAKIAFAKNAIVDWIPPSTLKLFTKMVFRFARGDVYAGIIRPKVLLIFLRYIFGILLFLWGVFQLILGSNFWILFGLIPTFLLFYGLWSIIKNYAYTKGSWHWLPVLQIASDLAVIKGSICGLVKRIRRKSYE